MLDKVLVKKIEEVLQKNYISKNEEGYWEYEAYVDYNDYFEYAQLKDIFSSKLPREKFNSFFYEGNYYMFEMDCVFSMLRDGLTKKEYEDNISYINEWVIANVEIKLPFAHFENQTIPVNITIDTGDGDYDYTLNNFMNFYANDIEDLEIEDKSSILWLVMQQGYSKKDLLDVIEFKHDKEDKFLSSLSEELLNSTSSMNALVFSVEMTVGELLNYLEEPKDITVSEDTSCGLVDYWYGAGSLLNISLNKDVFIPKEIFDIGLDGSRGYSIKSIYGLGDDFWTKTLVA